MAEKSCRVYVGNLSWRVKWQDLKDHMKQAGDVIRADVFEDPETGRSKGCGVVEFGTSAEAQRAISELTDTELLNRLIFVREDREEEGGRGGGRSYRGGGGGGRRGMSNGSYHERGSYHDEPRGYNDRGSYNGGGGRGRSYNDRGYYNNGPPRESRYESRGPPRSYHNEDIRGRQVFISNLPYRTSWQDLKDLLRDCGTIVRADVLSFPDGASKGVGTVLFTDEEGAKVAQQQYHEYTLQGRKIGVKIDT